MRESISAGRLAQLVKLPVVPGGVHTGVSLWVIGLAEIGGKHLLSAGLFAASSGFDCDKYGTDFLHKIRVVHLQHPAPLTFGNHPQEAQATRRVPVGFRRRPDLETMLCIEYRIFIQIERVKSERFTLGQKNASKSLALVTIRVGVADIDDMQLTGRHKLRNIFTRRRKLSFQIKGGTRDPQLI